MIFDANAHVAIDNLGWVDHGALWVFDVKTQAARTIPVEGASFLGIRAGSDGLFRVVHQQGPELAVSVRRCAEPEVELAGIRGHSGRFDFSGSTDLWAAVDPSLVVSTANGQALMFIDASRCEVRPLDLSWFNASAYDLGYQGLTDCLWLPDLGCVLVSVQRSSKLIKVDIDRDEKVGAIELADRHGNPKLYRTSPTELIAGDYDTLCKVDLPSGRLTRSVRLQPAAAPNTAEFIGDFWRAGEMYGVARPFSRDVVLVDSNTLKIRAATPVEGQPLTGCMTSATTFLVRDWKTGRLETGEFKMPRMPRGFGY